jgi:hypothetical protein
VECVCGCGRNISKDLADRNYIAATVAIELLAWDKNRALPGPEPEGREGLIARGVECYEKLLYSLHGEGGGDPDAECNAWLDEARAMRAHRSDMTKRRFFGGNAVNVNKEDLDRLDHRSALSSLNAEDHAKPVEIYLHAIFEPGSFRVFRLTGEKIIDRHSVSLVPRSRALGNLSAARAGAS